MPKVIVPIATGFEEIEAITVVDVLRRAGIEVVMASLEGLHIKGAHGIEITTDAFLCDSDVNVFDMIVLPGGLPGATNLAADIRVQSLLQDFDKAEKHIAAICAAPYALKTAGVLKNHYTCYPSFETKINHHGYCKDSDVVSDENIITSQGPRTAMAFAIALVEILLSKEASVKLQKDLLFTV
ncbi:MAG: DJ-1/PfpI family protein [Sulfurospirillaceae bacterium]|nr:DJ-1/PfpI family protein [Sulfurospirillaceae bacterium]